MANPSESPSPFSERNGAEHRDEVETLYLQHHAWLKNWLMYRLRSSEKYFAADLTQDTFVRILDSCSHQRLQALREPRAYLCTVAHGVLVSWLRRRSLEHAWQEALASLPEPLAPSAEQQYIILETLHEIDTMLDTLKPRVKQAFLMATLDGLKQQEIAQILNVSVPTVKSYIHKAWLSCLSLMPDDMD